MDLKKACENYFYQSIKSAPVSNELKIAAQKHQTFKSFQTKLYNQILDIELLRTKQGKQKLKNSTIKELIKSFVHTYLYCVESEAIKRAESDIAREMRERQKSKLKDLDQTITTGHLTGDYEELKGEVIITDESTR